MAFPTTQSLLLSVMAAEAETAWLTKTQLRVTLFLLDTEAAAIFSGPHYQWTPTPWGPMANDLDSQLNNLAGRGFVTTKRLRKGILYRLSAQGRDSGLSTLAKMPTEAFKHLKRVLRRTRSMDGRALIEDVIQSGYPNMYLSIAAFEMAGRIR